MKRSLAVSLTISVVLNILLAGMVLGNISSRFVTTLPEDIQIKFNKLPPEAQASFNNILGPAKKKMDNERAQIDAEKKKALHILTSEPFDAAAYLAQLEHISSMHAQMKRHISEAVAELAKNLTQEQRSVVAEIISQPPYTSILKPNNAKNPPDLRQ